MTTRYETAILFDPELPEDQRKEFLAKLAGIVAGYTGEVLKQDDWGTRKLAYPIRKKQNAYYTFFVYTGSRGVVEEIERNLKIFDSALRFLSTRYDTELKVKAAAPAVPEAPAAPETPPAPAGDAPPSAPPA